MTFPLPPGAMNTSGVTVLDPGNPTVQINPSTRTWALSMSNSLLRTNRTAAVKVLDPGNPTVQVVNGSRHWGGIGVLLIGTSQGWALVE